MARTLLQQSSLKTRAMVSMLREALPDFDIGDTGYYATVGRNGKRRCAMLNVQGRSIRVMLRLPVEKDPQLTETKSTRRWKDSYPSQYKWVDEDDLPKVVQLVRWADGEESQATMPETVIQTQRLTSSVVSPISEEEILQRILSLSKDVGGVLQLRDRINQLADFLAR